MFSVRANVNFVCSLSFQVKFNWNVFKWNSNLLLFESINLPNSIDTSLAELIIKSNTLSYGIYRFNSTIDLVIIDPNGIKVIRKENQVYLRIIDSGIIVYALPDGILELTLGSLQSLDLNPIEYSYDLDYLIDVRQLQFNFYCLVNSNKLIWKTGLSYPRINMSTIDLYQFKILNNSQLMNENTTCFDSPGMSI
jgi:hypothetical protein